MKNADISIIMPLHNSQETLKECLSAIIDSDYKNYELLIVDDNSTDDSATIAKEFPCRIVTLETNVGAASARNRGVLEAKNDILLFIDSDIIIKSNSINNIIRKLLDNDSIMGVSGTYDLHNRFKNFLSQYKHLVACYRDRMCEDINQDSFRGAFFALRKAVFNKVKFQESTRGASIEDIEFGRELISLGYEFVLDKTIEVEHCRKYNFKTFIKNQYRRSQDVFRSFIKKRSYKFYLSKKRSNVYAKMYFLRVPLAIALLLALCGAFIFTNSAYVYCILFLVCMPIAIEYGFLKFCFKQKGFIFTIKCVLVYFLDGFVSSLGVLKGLSNILWGGSGC